MYQNGRYLIVRSGGVWQIEQVEADGYRLVCPADHSRCQLPLHSDKIVREITPAPLLHEIIERIPYLPVIQAPNNQVRRDFYQQAMEQFEEIAWIRVIKSVYLREQEKKLAPFEKEFRDQAIGYLHGEIAVEMGVPFDQVEAYVEGVIAQDIW